MSENSRTTRAGMALAWIAGVLAVIGVPLVLGRLTNEQQPAGTTAVGVLLVLAAVICFVIWLVRRR